MPSAVYDNKFTGERIGPRKFPTPKRIEDPYAWLRAVRKVIPEVPDVIKGDGTWILGTWTTDTKILILPLLNVSGEKANIAINRETPMIG